LISKKVVFCQKQPFFEIATGIESLAKQFCASYRSHFIAKNTHRSSDSVQLIADEYKNNPFSFIFILIPVKTIAPDMANKRRNARFWPPLCIFLSIFCIVHCFLLTIARAP